MPSSSPPPQTGSEQAGPRPLPSLPPGLVALIRTPRKLSAVRLWQALEPDERVRVLKGHIQHRDHRQDLVELIAGQRNFRERTVRRWDDGKIVQWALRLRLSNSLAGELLHSMHAEMRREMLADFLDALGIPNDDGLSGGGVAGGGVRHADVSEADVHRAAEDLVREHGLRRATVYFLMLAVQDVPFQDHLWSWIEGSVDRGSTGAGAESADADTGEEELYDGDVEGESDPGRHRSFTTLDRLLIEAIVDSKQEVVGSLDADEVDDAVDEFVNLNGRRQHSYFHLGFRDVLFSGKPRSEIPATNRKRARWYWAGAILAWARSRAWSEIVAAYDEHAVVRRLGDGSDFATQEAARQVVRALWSSERAGEVAGFVAVRGILRYQALFGALLDIGTELLRQGEVGQARTIFDRLMKAVRALEREGQAPAFHPFLVVRRRHAHCLQRTREHDRARRQLETLLELDSDPNHLAMIRADLGLLAGNFNSLDEVSLPADRADLRDFIDRLREGREEFRRSVEDDVPYAAHGHYCLGVLALGENVLEPEVADHSVTSDHLLRAHSRFAGQPRDYGATLIARTSLYLGIAEAASLDSAGTLSHAANVMVPALEQGAALPPYLARVAVEGLGLGAGAEALTRFARALLSTGDDGALSALRGSSVAVQLCDDVRDGLRRRAERLGRSEAAATDLRACLDGYLRAGQIADARDILDRLEDLAVQGVGSEEFEELLASKGFQPAWEPEEAVVANARCLESSGRYPDAVQLLLPLVHQFAGEGRLDEAEGILERIRSYGLPEDHYAAAVARMRALSEQSRRQESNLRTPDDEEARGPVRVLFVGGDERQERAEAAVRRRLRERAPHVDVTFIHPGWSGNWSRHLDRVRRELPDHDALVVMRFVRTEFGKQIRRHCGKPWRCCWAPGAGGMADSIVAAARAASPGP